MAGILRRFRPPSPLDILPQDGIGQTADRNAAPPDKVHGWVLVSVRDPRHARKREIVRYDRGDVQVIARRRPADADLSQRTLLSLRHDPLTDLANPRIGAPIPPVLA